MPRRFTDMLSHKPADPTTPSAQGMHPSGELLQASDGMYYGVTMFGGINNTGTVYRLDTKRRGGFTTIYSFAKLDSSGHNTNGGYPIGALEEDVSNPGTLYGAAFQGGSNGNGTLYKVTTAGTCTRLHTFAAVDSSGNNSDGTLPIGGLIQAADGNFYGCAAHGGTGGSSGTLFKMTSSGTYSVLHIFNGTDGKIPMGLLEDSGSHGVFYGTTEASGPTTKNGTVFKVTAAGTFTTTHNFANANTSNPSLTEGVNPGAGLTQSADGTYFVGTTRNGGGYGGGTAYKVTRSGTVTILSVFDKPNSYGSNVRGSQPEGLLTEDTQNAGHFFGTAPFGGGGHGVIFQTFAVYTALPPGTAADYNISPQHIFNGLEGDKPYFALTLGPDNKFRSVVPYGGVYTAGNYIGSGLAFSFNGVDSSFETISHVANLSVSPRGFRL